MRAIVPTGGLAFFGGSELDSTLFSHTGYVNLVDWDGNVKWCSPTENAEDFHRVVEAAPEVFNHNTETVPRLYKRVRGVTSEYAWTLGLLKRVKELNPSVKTKSGLMLGLGETNEEILEAMDDLRSVGVDIVTFGQYLRPTHAHLLGIYEHAGAYERASRDLVAIGERLVRTGQAGQARDVDCRARRAAKLIGAGDVVVVEMRFQHQAQVGCPQVVQEPIEVTLGIDQHRQTVGEVPGGDSERPPPVARHAGPGGA